MATHWIEPSIASRAPHCWVYLDTETQAATVAAGERQTWRLGVTCHDHQGRERGLWRDPEWAVHDSPRALWEWVDAKCPRAGRCVVVAHNAGFDLRISDAFAQLDALGWRLDQLRPDRESVSARWRRGKQTIQVADTFAWWPCPLATIGADLGIDKLPLPGVLADADTWTARCVRDVLILQSAWRELLAWLWSEDLGSWQATGAGQAWSAWRRRWYTDTVLVGGDPTVRALERRACWAGRCEAWQHGRRYGQPYEEWDYQTAYLAVMATCEVPTVHLGRLWAPPLAEVGRLAVSHAVLCHVDVVTTEPVLPAEGPDGIVWPVGAFESVCWENELAAAIAAGAQVTVRRAEIYERAPALAAFARWVEDRIVTQEVPVSPLVYRTLKHWSRALVGRFGVRYSTWEPYGEAGRAQPLLGYLVTDDGANVTRLLTIGDECLIESGLVEGDNAVPAIMGWIMAECRVRLWAAMLAAGLDHVVYVDTDGLIVDRTGAWRLARAHLPGLRRKGRYRQVQVYGPRQLVLGGELRAAGVPRRATRVSARRWEGEVWPRLASSLAAGDVAAVTVARRPFTLGGTDHRRRHVARGRTAAVVLDRE